MFRRKLDDRITLRALRVEDAERVFELTDANRSYLRRWLPWLDAARSPDDTRAAIERGLEQEASRNGFHAGIFEDERLIGAIGLHYVDWVNRATSIGYWLAEPFVGRGIMTRCCRALVEHAFTDLKLHRVEIRVAVGNRRSRAIPERLGFREEGTIRDGEWLYDHYVDLVVYGLLEEAWRQLPP
jgi:ribosomal-protein-serine acetyltransferase